MKMPCCTCVQCLCQQDDGTMIAIFKHDDDEPSWFGHRKSKIEVCNGTRCRLVQLDRRLAANWQRQGRYISVIGVSDAEEVSRLTAWFDDARNTLPN